MQISPRMPHEVTLIHSIETDDMVGLEALLHERYADKRMNGEWFALSDEDVNEIKKKGTR
jgi:Meiotically up-regulated gene 113